VSLSDEEHDLYQKVDLVAQHTFPCAI